MAISDAYVDTREAIDDLHLNALDENFLAWLQKVSTNFEIFHHIPVKISNPPERFNLPPEIQLQLTRITQEVFSNIRKHANASEIQINFHSGDEGLIFEIQDNGQGFASEDIFEPSQHGLKSMQERAALITTELEVTSQIGIGTTIRMLVPEKILGSQS
jgi:two-component system nitrate/nitrite sensor histidine kinase NarX